MAQALSGSIKLEYEQFGSPQHPAVIMIMGLGAQMIVWPKALCEHIAKQGYHVIRFDNRDIGLSTKLSHEGAPNLGKMFLASRFKRPVLAPYTLYDMANDVLNLMAALSIPQAHFIGASMGGMIAQIIAGIAPEKTLSLTSIMSTSGAKHLPMPHTRVLLKLLRPQKEKLPNREITQKVRTLQTIGSQTYPTSPFELFYRVHTARERDSDSEGTLRQAAAIIASECRIPLLKTIATPTLIIHGTEDRLIPLECGLHTARVIPEAQMKVIEGMGHDLPSPLLPRIQRSIIDHLTFSSSRLAHSA
ncbi:MAG: alpha/beta fold hydrolase [Pseudomonadales bacterium]|nr:alpha/beta fold hydrolase [Pseudomonadales bacterium]